MKSSGAYFAPQAASIAEATGRPLIMSAASIIGSSCDNPRRSGRRPILYSSFPLRVVGQVAIDITGRAVAYVGAVMALGLPCIHALLAPDGMARFSAPSAAILTNAIRLKLRRDYPWSLSNHC